jgi:hypothetical protein
MENNSNIENILLLLKEQIKIEKLKMSVEFYLQKITLITNIAKLNGVDTFKKQLVTYKKQLVTLTLKLVNTNFDLKNNQEIDTEDLERDLLQLDNKLEQIVDFIDLIDSRKRLTRLDNRNYGREYIKKGLDPEYATNNYVLRL